MAGTEGSGASRAGGDSLHNEDAFLVEEGMGLYVVCDGLSGRPAGEVASSVAVTALEEFVSAANEEARESLERLLLPTRFADAAVRFALDCVLRAAETDPALAGMTTTLTMLLIHGNRGVIGHSGDSRLYLARRGRIHQLTLDHELTEELERAPLSDAARQTSGPSVDTFAIDLRPNDVYILCTDGVEAVLDEQLLTRSALELTPRFLASRIVSAAHRNNPECDATVVVVRVRREHEPAWLELSTPPEGTSFGHTIAVA